MDPAEENLEEQKNGDGSDWDEAKDESLSLDAINYKIRCNIQQQLFNFHWWFQLKNDFNKLNLMFFLYLVM